MISNKHSPRQALLTLFAFCLSLALVHGGDITLEDYITSFNFDFATGEVNITQFRDAMVDRSGDGTNDTLVIILTANTVTAGSYRISAAIEDQKLFLSNGTTETLSPGTTDINVSLNTSLLSQNLFNYSVSIFDSAGAAVYFKSRVSTQPYTAYARGIALGTITDENINNDYVRINLSINSTIAESVNVSVFLNYSNASSISQTAEIPLSIGNQTISINVSNETLKGTHTNTSYTLAVIAIGERLFSPTYSTALYRWEDFAKTPYIREVVFGRVDENANNLSEWLQLNVTLVAQTADSYVIEGELRDSFDQFVVNFSNSTGNLGAGTHVREIRINGTRVYQSKINGPYVLTFVKLLNSTATYDTVLEKFIANVTSFDAFEKPPLPDLTINMSVHRDNATNVTRVGINISNVGYAPAHDVFMDIFNNLTFENQTFTAELNVSQVFNFSFNVTNDNYSIYTAIVDFPDVVEESNESNNVATNAPVPPPPIANETEGDNATEQGINSSLNTNRSIFNNQKVYIRYTDNDQKWGSFDKVAINGPQRWAFNYVTNESFTNLTSLDNRVLIWENQSLTSDQIKEQVSLFINQTRV